MSSAYVHVCIEGAPKARGVEYGRQAAALIGVSLRMYRELFEAYASMSWEQAVRKAERFEPFIKSYMPDAIEEMHGIAEGAGVAYGDILALNCRSELMFALPDACTSMVIPPEAAADGKPYIAQTWDWLAPARASCMILEIRQHPLPTILMICEAGMVGGKGVNSAGIGCGMNALGIGRGQIGTPLHILFRGVMNSVKISDALQAVAQPVRAGCGNFFMGSAEGFVQHVEFTPDSFDVLMAEDTAIAHANHFLSPIFAPHDKLKELFTCSYARHHRAKMQLRKHQGQLNRERVFDILADHANFPDSLCNHEDPRDPQWSRYCTIYGFFVDLTARTLWVTKGNPCERQWHPYYLHPGA